MNRIIGIGVDIVEISRIRSILEKHGERFLSRVFTEAEKEYAMSGAKAAERLAGRFAVKEAVIKALGLGTSSGITLRDIETIPGPGSSGKPIIRLHNQAIRCLKWKGGSARSVHVSIAHDGGKAIAFVVLEQMEEKK